MPETSDIPVTTAQLTAGLAGLTHGPYADASTASPPVGAARRMALGCGYALRRGLRLVQASPHRLRRCAVPGGCVPSGAVA
jgi:hypothetical protein